MSARKHEGRGRRPTTLANAGRVVSHLRELQSEICRVLERDDGGSGFGEDAWSRPGGGSGLTRVLRDGRVFERVGVNFSDVRGEGLPASATARRPDVAGRPFRAAGVSVVAHPRNPYVPTSHFNLRFFSAGDGSHATWWFGGGMDLTPYYAFEEDVVGWHRALKGICDPFGPEVYGDFKRWCDEYFYLPHRDELRGVGGIFFDDLDAWGFERCFDFARAVGDAYARAYLPIVRRRRDLRFGERERAFQHYRRGRYVEFNLVYDRGTRFGLQTGGRTESILVSLPPSAQWRYDWRPEPGSPEARLYEEFLRPREWVTS